MSEKIITVFPKDHDIVPQDFETWEEAKEYAEEVKNDYGVECDIEEAY